MLLLDFSTPTHCSTMLRKKEKLAERSLLFFHFRPTTFLSICPPTRILHFLVFLPSCQFIVLSFLCSDTTKIESQPTHFRQEENSSYEHGMTMTGNLLVNTHKTIRERKGKPFSLSLSRAFLRVLLFLSLSLASFFFPLLTFVINNIISQR